jgi:hypothetical protein
MLPRGYDPENMQQVKLRRLLNEAATKGCTGYAQDAWEARIIERTLCQRSGLDAILAHRLAEDSK